MYEQFFDMGHTPFTMNVPADQLYESQAIKRDPWASLLCGRPPALCCSDRRSRMWEIHPDPPLLRGTPKRGLHRAVPVGFKADSKMVLQGFVRPAWAGIPVLPRRFQTPAPAGDRDHPWGPPSKGGMCS